MEPPPPDCWPPSRAPCRRWSKRSRSPRARRAPASTGKIPTRSSRSFTKSSPNSTRRGAMRRSPSWKTSWATCCSCWSTWRASSRWIPSRPCAGPTPSSAIASATSNASWPSAAGSSKTPTVVRWKRCGRKPNGNGNPPTDAPMTAFVNLLRRNRNYRYTWAGQIVSEIGDHFNNIAVFSLAVAHTKSGLVVAGVMLARAIPAMLAGPLAGVTLDRTDRKRVMIASDLIRALVAGLFILTVNRHDTWLLYLLSALLMFASPFFTSGRASILPAITNRKGHTKTAHPDHPVDHARDRRVSGRRQRDAVRLPVGLFRQRPFVRGFRAVHFAAVSAGARIPPAAPSAHRSPGGAALA